MYLLRYKVHRVYSSIYGGEEIYRSVVPEYISFSVFFKTNDAKGWTGSAYVR